MSPDRTVGPPDGPRRGRLRVVVSGMIAGVPDQGGATWAILQYVLGLRRLGHEVYFIEPVEPGSLRPADVPLGATTSAAYFRKIVATFGLEGTAALLLAGTRETVGLPYDALRGVVARTDLLLNVSGMLADEALLAPIPRRAYLDLDPGFVQLWCAQGLDMRFDAHSHFVTIGLSIGQPDCPVPTCGRSWITTPQPIVLEHWPVATRIEHDALTTVANWRGYGSIEHEGVFYGQKAHSLRRLMGLPGRTSERFLLALAIHPDEQADLEALSAHGWQRTDPGHVAGSPARYQRFIRGSRGELGIAKDGYVAARCGWFSDRSIAYLASGRPVLAQETGFSRHIPVGEGVLTFTTEDDAVAAVEELRTDYPRHARAARDMAERYFDSDRVLPRLLARLGLGP